MRDPRELAAIFAGGMLGAVARVWTFSTMELEILTQLRDGRVGLAIGYAAASIVSGYVAIWLTTASVRRLRRLA
jgi:CrcB protein